MGMSKGLLRDIWRENPWYLGSGSGAYKGYKDAVKIGKFRKKQFEREKAKQLCFQVYFYFDKMYIKFTILKV